MSSSVPAVQRQTTNANAPVESKCCPLSHSQKKVILGIILFLGIAGIGAMIILYVPLKIIPWKVTVGASISLAVIMGGSIAFYRRSTSPAKVKQMIRTDGLVPGQNNLQLLGKRIYYKFKFTLYFNVPDHGISLKPFSEVYQRIGKEALDLSDDAFAKIIEMIKLDFNDAEDILGCTPNGEYIKQQPDHQFLKKIKEL